MELNKNLYLVVIDYYSQFPELIQINNTKANTLIVHLKSMFARYGIPEIIFSDNGSPFQSKEFQKFCNEWSIVNETSSPKYPQSNGLVERNIQTLKKMLKKCFKANQDPYVALLNFRNTPKGKMPSPSNLLMSRNLRTKLFVQKSNLQSKPIPYTMFHKLKSDNIKEMKKYHKGKGKLSELKVGDPVYFKKLWNAEWEQGCIVKNVNNRARITL